MSTQMISVDLINADPSLNIARTSTTPADCEELAASISTKGLQTPIMVRPVEGDRYEMVYGFRRYTAVAVNLGLDEIECYVKEMTRREAMILNVTENIQRKDMTFWEECCAVRDCFPEGTKLDIIASAFGKSINWVRRRMAVWKMPWKVRNQIKNGLLTASHIDIIMRKDPEDQLRTAAAIKKGVAAGKSFDLIATELLPGRKKARPRKNHGIMLTHCLEKGYDEAVIALRWVCGEISDTLCRELLDKNRKV